MSKHLPSLITALGVSVSTLLAGPFIPESNPPEHPSPADFTVEPFAPHVTTLQLDLVESITKVSELEDLSARAPNLFISDASRRGFGNSYTLRGLGSRGSLSDSAVPVFVDDVPLGDTFTYFQPLFDVETVDVFRRSAPRRSSVKTPRLRHYASSYGLEWEVARQFACGLGFSGKLGYNQSRVTGIRTPEAIRSATI